MYGVSSHSLRQPNSKMDSSLIKGIFYEPYFNIYAEFFLDGYTQDFDKTCNKTLNNGKICTASPQFSFVLFVIFILLGNILMISLLTAKFTTTIDLVMAESNIHYGYLRFFVIKEYTWRPFACSPISFIFIILSFFLNLRPDDPFLLNDFSPIELEVIERKGRDKYIRASSKLKT